MKKKLGQIGLGLGVLVVLYLFLPTKTPLIQCNHCAMPLTNQGPVRDFSGEGNKLTCFYCPVCDEWSVRITTP